MYNVKGPSKIVAKTRRGLPQNVDNFREHMKSKSSCNNNNNNYIIDGPRPVFQNIHKKNYSQKNKNHQQENNIEVTPQHEEIIKYVNDSWNCVSSEIYANSSDGSSSPVSDHSSCAIYYEDEPATGLENFKPFDLESWWGRRLFTYITNSVNNTV